MPTVRVGYFAALGEEGECGDVPDIVMRNLVKFGNEGYTGQMRGKARVTAAGWSALGADDQLSFRLL
jgi:hypothetical protein